MSLLHGITTTTLIEGARSVEISATSVIGVVVTAPEAVTEGDYAWPLNTPVQINGSTHASQLIYGNEEGSGDDGGTALDVIEAIYAQARCPIVAVRVEEGVFVDPNLEGGTVEGNTLAENAAGSAVDMTGVYALLNAQSVIGLKPRIIAAPGLPLWGPGSTTELVGALMAVADRLRAIVVLDGPNYDAASANDCAEAVSGTRSRAYMVDPYVVNGDVTLPAAAYVCGLISKTDQEDYYGWAASPSNRGISGITGTSRPIESGVDGSEGDTLNANHIACITNQGNGYILWGVRTLEKDESMLRYMVQRRTADIVQDAIEAAHRWAVDKGIRSTLIEDIVETVNGFLRQLKAQGRILGGTCWVDPEINTTTSINGGKLYVDYDVTPVPPLENLNFNQRLTGKYAVDLDL